MPSNDIALLEFDPSLPALIEPSQEVKQIDAPEHCVICFFREVIEKLEVEGKLKLLAHHQWEDDDRPLYEMEFSGQRLAVYQSGVGAPLAVGLFEEIIARGCSKFIACGGAGVLDSEISFGNLLIPVEALRDEGTSFHYLPPGRSVAANPDVLKVIENLLRNRGIEYRLIKTWTTDAPYRETPNKIDARRSEGCSTVDMETAAFFAAAQFRKVMFGQLLYGGDDVSGSVWDERGWQNRKDVRQGIFNLAAEICLKL